MKVSDYPGSWNWANLGLTSFEGAPRTLIDAANFSCNYLTTFEHAPQRTLSFHCSNNKFESLKDIHKHIHRIDGILALRQNPIKSHVLGVLLIDGLQFVYLDNQPVQTILNKHLGKGRAGMLQAQEELIEAGLEEFAQL